MAHHIVTAPDGTKRKVDIDKDHDTVEGDGALEMFLERTPVLEATLRKIRRGRYREMGVVEAFRIAAPRGWSIETFGMEG